MKPCDKKNRNQERDSFFEFWGISEEEEEFFKTIYKRETMFRWTIVILIALLIGAVALLLLR